MEPLISFSEEESKDIFLYETKNIKLTDSFIVISIIGAARKGKSTFLNCIISFLAEDNKYIFDISNLGIHSTRGINIYTYGKYLFLDCEGIQKEDSANDAKLLLISYLISDIIIFNETTDFNNGSINQLMPLTAFSNIYIHTHTCAHSHTHKNKPELIIRVANYDLDTDINIAISNTINIKRKDNYQSIRESILQLFSHITGYSTQYISKKDQKDLEKGLFLNIINEENNFLPVIASIIDKTKTYEPKLYETIYNKITTIINTLNTNTHIDIKDLDINTIIQEKHINTFLESIDKSIYYPILIVNGYREEYNTLIEPRRVLVSELLERFKNEFKLLNPILVKNKYKILKTELNKEIIIAENKSKEAFTSHYNDTFLSTVYANFRVNGSPKINQVIKDCIFKFLYNKDIVNIINKVVEDYLISPYIKYQYNDTYIEKIKLFKTKLIDICNKYIGLTYISNCILNNNICLDIKKYGIELLDSENPIYKNIDLKNIKIFREKFLDIEIIDKINYNISQICDCTYNKQRIFYLQFDDLKEPKIKYSRIDWRDSAFKVSIDKYKYINYDKILEIIHIHFINKIEYEFKTLNGIRIDLDINKIKDLIDIYYVDLRTNNSKNIFIKQYLFTNKSNYYTKKQFDSIIETITPYYDIHKLLKLIMNKSAIGINLINFTYEFGEKGTEIVIKKYYIKKLINKIIKYIVPQDI